MLYQMLCRSIRERWQLTKFDLSLHSATVDCPSFKPQTNVVRSGVTRADSLVAYPVICELHIGAVSALR
jgi:hypothetical protein